ncbi:hypothetical protein ILUMI_07032, partial [Ignelater luminosus]
ILIKQLPDDLITEKPKQLLKRFGVSTDFLELNPTLWKENESYRKAVKILNSLRVVNDKAGRGVKLIDEFNSKITKKEDEKQYLLEV